MPSSGKQQGNQQKQKNTQAKGKPACQQIPQAARHWIHLTATVLLASEELCSLQPKAEDSIFFVLCVTFGLRTSCQGLSQAG